MKAFKSSLFSVYQVLYNNIIDDKYPIIDKDEAEHIVHFMESLNADHSTKGIRKAVEKAIEESEDCQKCSDCQKCAKRFYLEVAKIKLPNYDTTRFSKMSEELNLKYGALSFRKPPALLSKHMEDRNTVIDFYKQQFSQDDHDRPILNNLIMLKGMSSASPYMYNNFYHTHRYTGGGFYVNWNGIGIVVDPGYGFVDNMNKNQIGIQDVDIVILTHYHIDHTNDMRIIDDMNYQIQERGKKHILYWYMDHTTHSMLYNGFDENINKDTVVEKDMFGDRIAIRENILLAPFKTIHVKDYKKSDSTHSTYKDDTFGFVLELTDEYGDKVKIGYTSDTTYYEELVNSLEGCDIIIANISGIYMEDYLLIKQKENHLGYRGCYKLFKNIKSLPKIIIISEFWNGISDIRFDICKTMSGEIGDSVKLFPGDIGMHIDMKNHKIKCSQCGNYASLENIHTVRPIEDFDGIAYVCDDCIY